MIAAVADTHVVHWYLFRHPRLSAGANTFIQTTIGLGDQIAISSVSLIEMVYLIEKRRIPAEILSRVAHELRLSVSLFIEIPIDLSIARTLSRIDVGQVPDMPDRIIAATALHLNVPVISRDRKIQLSSIGTIW
jgi:PIN domain nuclease of toxin-antitoxin system